MSSVQVDPVTIEDAYVFQRGYAARARLNYQYHLWQDTFRFHLHPSLPSLPENAKIADVATGSGMWLLDLAKQTAPGVRLDGFDISLDQCPPKAWLPSNVTFRTWNLFDQVPKDMLGAYDVVHLRLIGVVIKDNNPTPVIKNLLRLLKPGGYLQWEEHNADIGYLSKVSPDIEAPGLEQLKNMLTQPTKGEDGQYIVGPRTWLRTLPDTLEKEGFQEAKVHIHKEEPYMASFWSDLFMVGAEEMADIMLKDKFPARDKMVRDMASAGGKEILAGVAVGFDKCVTVARKAQD